MFNHPLWNVATIFQETHRRALTWIKLARPVLPVQPPEHGAIAQLDATRARQPDGGVVLENRNLLYILQPPAAFLIPINCFLAVSMATFLITEILPVLSIDPTMKPRRRLRALLRNDRCEKATRSHRNVSRHDDSHGHQSALASLTLSHA